MSGSLDNPSTWRLRTPGGIPYRFKKITGSVGRQEASVVWTVIVPSVNLVDFLAEVFPAPVLPGLVSNPTYFKLSNLTGLVATNASFESMDDGKPVDPFGFDTEAALGTYFPALIVNVTFEAEKPEPDPADPVTFLDISGSASAEVLSMPITGKAKFIEEREDPCGEEEDKDTGEIDDVVDDVPEDVDPCDEEAVDEAEAQRTGTSKDVKMPNIPLIILDPRTEWTMRWSQIPYEKWKDIIIKRLRALIGRVNKAKFKPLFDAKRETLLLVGYTYSQKNNWRFGREGGPIEIPPVTVEIKFIEKHSQNDGLVVTHNHRYNPDTNKWEYLKINDKPVFRLADFDLLFRSGSREE